jgi:hypothetical protein
MSGKRRETTEMHTTKEKRCLEKLDVEGMSILKQI